MEPCPPYVHELNGTAERYNRTIMDSARCLMKDSRLDRKYWPEVVKAASYLRNRIIANTIEKKTPYEIFSRKKPNITNLRLYGSKVFLRVPEVKRNSKWDRKADLGILVGYENVGYRVLINNKITIARHVDIVENKQSLVGFNGDTDSDNESEKSIDERTECSEISENEINENLMKSKKKRNLSNRSDVSSENSEIYIRKAARERKIPERYGQNALNTNFIYVNVVSASTYGEALNSNDNDLWKKAMIAK